MSYSVIVLRGRVEQLEDLVANIVNKLKIDKNSDEGINNERMKRPAQLLPLQVLL